MFYDCTAFENMCIFKKRKSLEFFQNNKKEKI